MYFLRCYNIAFLYFIKITFYRNRLFSRKFIMTKMFTYYRRCWCLCYLINFWCPKCLCNLKIQRRWLLLVRRPHHKIQFTLFKFQIYWGREGGIYMRREGVFKNLLYCSPHQWENEFKLGEIPHYWYVSLATEDIAKFAFRRLLPLFHYLLKIIGFFLCFSYKQDLLIATI